MAALQQIGMCGEVHWIRKEAADFTPAVDPSGPARKLGDGVLNLSGYEEYSVVTRVFRERNGTRVVKHERHVNEHIRRMALCGPLKRPLLELLRRSGKRKVPSQSKTLLWRGKTLCSGLGGLVGQLLAHLTPVLIQCGFQPRSSHREGVRGIWQLTI